MSSMASVFVACLALSVCLAAPKEVALATQPYECVIPTGISTSSNLIDRKVVLDVDADGSYSLEVHMLGPFSGYEKHVFIGHIDHAAPGGCRFTEPRTLSQQWKNAEEHTKDPRGGSHRVDLLHNGERVVFQENGRDITLYHRPQFECTDESPKNQCKPKAVFTDWTIGPKTIDHTVCRNKAGKKFFNNDVTQGNNLRSCTGYTGRKACRQRCECPAVKVNGRMVAAAPEGKGLAMGLSCTAVNNELFWVLGIGHVSSHCGIVLGSSFGVCSLILFATVVYFQCLRQENSALDHSVKRATKARFDEKAIVASGDSAGGAAGGAGGGGGGAAGGGAGGGGASAVGGGASVAGAGIEESATTTPLPVQPENPVPVSYFY